MVVTIGLILGIIIGIIILAGYIVGLFWDEPKMYWYDPYKKKDKNDV